MAEYSNLTAFVDKDGNVIDCPALKYFKVTSKGNIEIKSPSGAKLNIESGDNEAHKPIGKIQLDSHNYVADDQKKIKIAVINDSKSKVEGMNIECAGIDFETAQADTAQGWTKNQFRLRFRGDNSEDTFADTNIHFRSLDLRARASAAGTGGGIALQPASCDSNLKENKLKIETDRIKDVGEGLPSSASEWSQFYNGEGGKGIEIGTINSQFTSLYTKTYRFKGDAPIYGVTRGALTTVDGKTDYPTQADDSKDIINDSSPITWNDIIAAVKFLKGNGSIS